MDLPTLVAQHDAHRDAWRRADKVWAAARAAVAAAPDRVALESAQKLEATAREELALAADLYFRSKLARLARAALADGERAAMQAAT